MENKEVLIFGCTENIYYYANNDCNNNNKTAFPLKITKSEPEYFKTDASC